MDYKRYLSRTLSPKKLEEIQTLNDELENSSQANYYPGRLHNGPMDEGFHFTGRDVMDGAVPGLNKSYRENELLKEAIENATTQNEGRKAEQWFRSLLDRMKGK